MTAPGFTAGEWAVTPIGTQLYVESKTGKFICDLQIDVVSSREERNEARANARLIAAAPDLLAACEVALVYPQPPLVENALRAALAKARGVNLNKDVKAHDPMNAYPQGRWSNPA